MARRMASVFGSLSAALWPCRAKASSARRTCNDRRSSSEYTATVGIPISWQARITRTAISPLLAMRTFLNTARNNGSDVPTRRFSDVRWFPEIDSTNQFAADLAGAGAADGLVVGADHQT